MTARLKSCAAERNGRPGRGRSLALIRDDPYGCVLAVFRQAWELPRWGANEPFCERNAALRRRIAAAADRLL